LRMRDGSRRWRGEIGFTITEVIIAGFIMSVVAAAFLTILHSVQTNLVRQENRSINNDQARLAMEDLDREIRSGEVLYAAEVLAPLADKYELRVYTQSNAPTRNLGNPICIQWRISSQQLLKRTWLSGNPAGATGWRVVAENVVNQNTSTPAFVLDPEDSSGGRIVNITLLVNAKLGDPAFSTVRLASSAAIRNQSAGDPCTPAPAG
jgi:type II secretory pathway pseudopilin PulG